MTKREALRQTEQERVLMSLGFTSGEAEQLRRISMTLHSWYERECGSDSRCIVRGRMNGGDFEYDDDGDAYEEYAGGSGRHRYSRIQDRERGAQRRLKDIISNHNARPDAQPVSFYLQTDPRGAALYIIRPGDVPEGADVSGYYSRGICVY